jgi:hypothetical protein
MKLANAAGLTVSSTNLSGINHSDVAIKSSKLHFLVFFGSYLLAFFPVGVAIERLWLKVFASRRRVD